MIVQLRNIQSYKDYNIVIDEPGCTQIVGDNSNGKSVLCKAMSFISKGDIRIESKRASIINDNCESGSITLSRNGMILNIMIHRVRDNCMYELTRPDGSVIRRTIREDGLDELVDEFGLVTFDGNICLQIFETFGQWPFINTKLSVSFEIMDYIITDKVASDFVDNYTKVTLPAFKERLSTLKRLQSANDEKLRSIVYYDKDTYVNLSKRMGSYARNLEKLKIYEPKRLPIFKTMKYVDFTIYTPRRLPIYKIAPEVPTMVSLHKVIDDYVKISNGECPTCGTLLKDRVVCACGV